MPAAQKPVNRLVGEQIRLRRCALGLTQSQLAERIDRHCTTVSLVERGVNNISMHTLARFAKALDIPAHSLIPF